MAARTSLPAPPTRRGRHRHLGAVVRRRARRGAAPLPQHGRGHHRVPALAGRRPGPPCASAWRPTGTYSLPLATALHAAGHTVFVCNPLSLARYRQATLARTKTDKLDARCIARFCAAHALHPWAPTSAAHQRLHVLVATRQTLLAQAHQLRNRQHAAGYTACPDLLRELQAPVLAALAAQLARIEQRARARRAAADTPIGTQLRLPDDRPGARASTTAATLVASLPVERLPTPKHVAAYVGLCPREKSSGVSVRGRSTIGVLRAGPPPPRPVPPGHRGDARQPHPPRLRRAPPGQGQARQGGHRRRHAQAAPARRGPCCGRGGPLRRRRLSAPASAPTTPTRPRSAGPSPATTQPAAS